MTEMEKELSLLKGRLEEEEEWLEELADLTEDDLSYEQYEDVFCQYMKHESAYESIQEMISECEKCIVEEQYEKLEDDILKKEGKVFKQFQIDRWSMMEFKTPRNTLSPYKKAERNKRKKKAKMKTSFAWTVI